MGVPTHHEQDLKCAPCQGHVFGVVLNEHVQNVAVVDDSVGERVKPPSSFVVTELRIRLLHLAQSREETFNGTTPRTSPSENSVGKPAMTKHTIEAICDDFAILFCGKFALE